MSQGIAFSGNVPTAICNNAKRKRQMIHWLCHYAMYAIQLEHTEKSAMSAGENEIHQRKDMIWVQVGATMVVKHSSCGTDYTALVVAKD